MEQKPRQRSLAARCLFERNALWLALAEDITDAAEQVALGFVCAETNLEDLELEVFDGVVASMAHEGQADEDMVWDICCEVVRDVWDDVKGRAGKRGVIAF